MSELESPQTSSSEQTTSDLSTLPTISPPIVFPPIVFPPRLSLAAQRAFEQVVSILPVSETMEKRVQFWVDIFTKFQRSEGCIISTRFPWLVFAERLSSLNSEKWRNEQKAQIATILDAIAQNKTPQFEPYAQKIRRDFGADEKSRRLVFEREEKRSKTLRRTPPWVVDERRKRFSEQSAERGEKLEASIAEQAEAFSMRVCTVQRVLASEAGEDVQAVRVLARTIGKELTFQRGFSDEFRGAIIRSGEHHVHIDSIMRKFDVPREFAFLPYFEAAFRPVTSHAQAVGNWQIILDAAKHLKMRVDHGVVDERLDTTYSTRGAAQKLRQEFFLLQRYAEKRLGGQDPADIWSLDATGYNTGAGRMQRAIEKLRTAKLDTIISKFDDKSFGYAGKNYVAELIATTRILADVEKYFPGVLEERLPSVEFSEIVLGKDKRYRTLELAMEASGLDPAEFHTLNPAILTRRSGSQLPEGFIVKIRPDRVRQALRILKGSSSFESEWKEDDLERTEVADNR